ncbi:MAG: TolC family protein [Prevotella sp.]|nr:TolC family protein [Candidatus Prevotella equi]
MKILGFIKSATLLIAFSSASIAASAKTWTLEECIQYAMDNNISLQRSGLTRQSSQEDWESAKAQLLPSLNFSSSHRVNYQPWPNDNAAKVIDGQAQLTMDKVYYNGSYSVNANWTVWNGNINRNQIKASKLSTDAAEQDSITTALNLQEQIAQLYIQILYTKEAIKVNKSTLEAAKVNEERGKQMLEVGSMSKADVSQLTATRALDEYNVVQAESQTRSYIRQLKQLLQITNEEPFDVADRTELTDMMALQTIPTVSSVYNRAIENRPEIKSSDIAIESAELQRKMATARRLPTVSMNASLGSNTNTMTETRWDKQMKTNFNMGAGVTVSVPILDQRQTRTAVNKAIIQKQSAQLEKQNKQTTLYSTIENYWIQAENYQNQYKAAKVSTESAKDSYDLLSEQFAVGLKNIVELQDGKTRLLSAQQNELQSKYMTILNIKMLEFYKK